ncbi:unnamed protein product [Adineta ricciae]|uniref:Uncharacterized protein n=1 Tax=Adineta ricciae TaxID=249248 RepID=A0A815FSU9_ADIRI|nr:unnamed protein product [Adineta ricciae]
MDQNCIITNVKMGKRRMTIGALATTGVDSCIAVATVSYGASNVFIGHYSTLPIKGFGESITLDSVRKFMEEIAAAVHGTFPLDSLETVFLIGGWDTKPYLQLQSLLRVSAIMKTYFIRKIDVNTDDKVDNWVCQFDLIVDRVTVPSVFILLQYVNVEMNDEAKKLVAILEYEVSECQLKKIFHAPFELNQPPRTIVPGSSIPLISRENPEDIYSIRAGNHEKILGIPLKEPRRQCTASHPREYRDEDHRSSQWSTRLRLLSIVAPQPYTRVTLSFYDFLFTYYIDENNEIKRNIFEIAAEDIVMMDDDLSWLSPSTSTESSLSSSLIEYSSLLKF